MTNTELLQPLKESFPDLWGGHCRKMKSFILSVGRPNTRITVPAILSMRQIHLATTVYHIMSES